MPFQQDWVLPRTSVSREMEWQEMGQSLNHPDHLIQLPLIFSFQVY
jgi:hypothetical protein